LTAPPRGSARFLHSHMEALLPKDAPRSDPPPPLSVDISSEGFLEATINMAESLTGIDLDGDGDIGLMGSGTTVGKRSIYDVVVKATQKERRKFFSATRRLVELEEMVENSVWLSPNMLKLKIQMRDGATSCSAQLADVLQGRCVQMILILLLLMDVSFVCAEIFLEAYYPSEAAVDRSACIVSSSSASAAPHLSHDIKPGTSLEWVVAWLTTELGGDTHHGDTCVMADVGYEVGYQVHGFWHSLHVMLSVTSFLILILFAIEIALLLCAFRELFLRSPSMMLDFFVVFLALWLQWQVLTVELGVGEAKKEWTGNNLTSLVLIFRCVRFARIYHGITSSMHQQQQQATQEMKRTIDELDDAVGDLVVHIPPGKLEVAKEKERIYELFKALRHHMESH